MVEHTQHEPTQQKLAQGTSARTVCSLHPHAFPANTWELRPLPGPVESSVCFPVGRWAKEKHCALRKSNPVPFPSLLSCLCFRVVMAGRLEDDAGSTCLVQINWNGFTVYFTSRSKWPKCHTFHTLTTPHPVEHSSFRLLPLRLEGSLVPAWYQRYCYSSTRAGKITKVKQLFSIVLGTSYMPFFTL